ncbi:MAG: ABC-F family ATP-binding cassette domain-containing protein [Clostridiales bacterium]|nr:ABC-F family ATP-binding cassette domain-containing protein [Clostridiales bacterium]
MNILSAEKISKAYSERILFNEISFGINEGEKIGLIGINGTGKSTLLKVVAGVENSDTGKIITGSSVTIEYLSQNPSFENDVTVLQQVFKGNSPFMKLLREYELALKESGRNPEDIQLEKRLLILTQGMDSMKAWTIENEAKAILTRLGVNDFASKIGILSGGQKKRIALAGALINPCDILILDEPTNQLDNDTVDWLEKYLNNRKGALLMVTHDRYFLGRVCNRIIELDNGKLYSYQANYTKYLEMKAEREESAQSSERKRKSLYMKELEWIKRGARARTTKQKSRIDRFETLKETKLPEAYENIEIKVGTTRLGKKTIELEHIGKDFSGNKIIGDFSYILLRDDRIGIIGPNGSGKSTLLKMIAGRLKPDRGSVNTGDTVKVGFFTQENDEIDEMDESIRVIDYIRNEAEYLTTGEGLKSASQMLERFLFPPNVQWTPVSKLSGGEKRRLYLLHMLMDAPNIILLDEPTNDLDIQTLTILESYLDDFQGAVIAVSHDRYFLDKVVDKIFIFDGNTSIKQFQGNYSDYSDYNENALKVRKENAVMKDSNIKVELDKDDYNTVNKKKKPPKFTFKEQKDFLQIDELVSNLEREINEVNKGIVEASSDFEHLQKLLSMRETLEVQLNEAMERWIYLNELAESISRSRKEPKK